MSTRMPAPGHYLIASDFDQTLSFNDSGLVLSELIGVPNFREKVAGLSEIYLVQQGAELAYLLRHDPAFRCVRREHLIETGKQVRLKKDIKRFVEALEAGADDYRFSFYVISAAPRAVVARGHRPCASHLRRGVRVRRDLRRDLRRHEGAGWLRQGGDSRDTGEPAAGQPRPHRVRRRRQLRHPRHAARQQREWLHDRSVGSQAHRAHRPTDRRQRQRPQRPGPHPRRRRELGRRADPHALRLPGTGCRRGTRPAPTGSPLRGA